MRQLMEEVRILKRMEDKMKTPLDHKVLNVTLLSFVRDHAMHYSLTTVRAPFYTHKSLGVVRFYHGSPSNSGYELALVCTVVMHTYVFR